jgi:hypothetical protein
MLPFYRSECLTPIVQPSPKEAWETVDGDILLG